MLFTTEELRHNTDHIDISIKAMRFQTVAAKYLKPILLTKLLITILRNPHINNLLQLLNCLLLLLPRLRVIIV